MCHEHSLPGGTRSRMWLKELSKDKSESLLISKFNEYGEIRLHFFEKYGFRFENRFIFFVILVLYLIFLVRNKNSWFARIF